VRIGRTFGFVMCTVAVACGSEAPSSTETPSSCGGVELIVAASDFYASQVCGAPGQCASGIDLGADPMLTKGAGRAFFLARDNDLLFEVDPSCGNLSRKSISLDPFALRDSAGRKRPANPHDAAAAPDGTIVVPLYDAASIAFIKDGQLDLRPLPLAEYDEVDGNPQADAVSIVDVGGVSKAFVTLERLDDNDFLRSTRPSQMLRIDIATRTVEAVIELKGRNPFNPMSEVGGKLFMAEPGNFDAANEDLAGIERFDTATSTSQLLVRERDLGGSVAEIAVTEGCGAAIVAGPQPTVNPTSVITFDPATGVPVTTTQSPVLGPTPGYDLQGLAWRGDLLYVGDRRRGAEGHIVHVLKRTEGCKLTDTGRTIELPQRAIALRAARAL
jgi:hypothetical protein